MKRPLIQFIYIFWYTPPISTLISIVVNLHVVTTSPAPSGARSPAIGKTQNESKWLCIEPGFAMLTIILEVARYRTHWPTR